MKNNRRDFLKLGGLAGLTVAGGGFLKGFAKEEAQTTSDINRLINSRGAASHKSFNMSGFAAPKIDVVRVGFIGVGSRGSGAVSRMSRIEKVEIKAISDITVKETDNVMARLKDTGQKPTVYNGGSEEWKKLCDRKDIDLIYIATPWQLHTPMALYAMNQGKHVCVEVPAATTLEEAWQLVETSERTQKHCMMLENCCYDFFELLTLNMARQGLFGEIMHVEGAYIHDLLDHNFDKEQYWDMWRLKENITRNGSLYPTHGLGPICQALDINRGDKMDYLVSVSSNDFMMGEKAKELAATDNFYAQFADKKFRGNMNTTTIRTHKGKTIMVQHDVTSPRPYSRIHLLSGTKGTALKYPLPGKISFSHRGWATEEEMKALEEKYSPNIVKKIGEMAKRVGGHGGMDFLMDWRTIDCLRNGLPLDQDVYDAALWSSIFPLSEISINNRSNSIDVPDFTRGSWITNAPVDITMEKGGNTGVKA